MNCDFQIVMKSVGLRKKTIISNENNFIRCFIEKDRMTMNKKMSRLDNEI